MKWLKISALGRQQDDEGDQIAGAGNDDRQNKRNLCISGNDIFISKAGFERQV